MIHLPRFEWLYTVDKNILTILETPALRRLEIRDNSYWETGVTLPVRMMAFIFCALTFGNLFIVYCDPAFNVDRGNASDHRLRGCVVLASCSDLSQRTNTPKKKSRTANTFFYFYFATSSSSSSSLSLCTSVSITALIISLPTLTPSSNLLSKNALVTINLFLYTSKVPKLTD